MFTMFPLFYSPTSEGLTTVKLLLH